MELSARSYAALGAVTGKPFEAMPEGWEGRAFGADGVRSWLKKEHWPPEERSAISDFLLAVWMELAGVEAEAGLQTQPEAES